jgi:hypothetical protein
LNNVTRINPFSDNPIETLIDHPSDRSSVSLKKSVHSRSVPLPNAIEENQRLWRRIRRLYCITGSVHMVFQGN